MVPLMLLAGVFGSVAGFVMGWIGGRVYGHHEGRAAALRERHLTAPRESAPVLPTPPAAPAGPVVLVVQNQQPAPTPHPAAVAGGYSQQLAELAAHLAVAEHTRGYLPSPAAAITTGHDVHVRPADLDGEVVA